VECVCCRAANPCRRLRRPVNGVLLCSSTHGGGTEPSHDTVCRLFCHRGLVPARQVDGHPQTEGRFHCDRSGTWQPTEHVPSCVGACVYTEILANVRYMLSPVRLSVCVSVCLSSVCLSSACNARATYSGGCNFRHFFLRHLVHLPFVDIHEKFFYGDRPRGTPLSPELNTTGVAKYSDFGPIKGYISETLQDRR